MAFCASDFRGVSDLGVLAGGGVLLCFFSTLSVLPALLKLDPRMGQGPQTLGRMASAERWLARHDRFITVASAAVLLFALLMSTRVGFTYDLLSLQAQDIDSVQTEKAMLREYNSTVLSGAVLVSGEEEARRVTEKLRQLETVGQVSTITDFLPQVSARKSDLVKQVVEDVRTLQVPTPVALDRARDLLSLQNKLKEIEERTSHVPRDPTVVAAVEISRLILHW